MTIELQTGQKISLEKDYSATLSKIMMGLGWDAYNPSGASPVKKIDLDASCVLFDEQGNVVDTVYFKQLKSKDGSVIHKGDNRTGEGDGDDEQITVDLDAVPSAVKSLVFTVSSYSGHSFETINNAFCRLVDMSTHTEIARYTLSAHGAHTAQIMAKLYRHNSEWKLNAIGANGTGRTIEHLLPLMTSFL